MTPPTPVAEALQAAELSGLVELFSLDLSPIAPGAPVLRFVGDHGAASVIVHDGDRYYPVPLEVEGFERGGTGGPARPTLRVGDAFGMIGAWVWAGQDLVGAELTRRVVLRDNLDTGDDPDPTAYVLLDVFRIEQKTSHTLAAIEFSLVARHDQGNKQLPGRQVLRDTCKLRYRVWTGSAWDYSRATCPYVGTDLFDVSDSVTVDEEEDQCSKRLKGCISRFPDEPLPTTAFPGVGRTR